MAVGAVVRGVVGRVGCAVAVAGAFVAWDGDFGEGDGVHWALGVWEVGAVLAGVHDGFDACED